MERIVHVIEIACPPQALFDFVTNACQWHRWHPATHSVRGAPDRPLRVGDTVTERIRAAHREFDATWTVTDCEPARLWRIRTATPLGESVLTYRLQPGASGGTRFERICDFRSHGAWRLLDGNLTKWMLARQARLALANLRRLLANG